MPITTKTNDKAVKKPTTTSAKTAGSAKKAPATPKAAAKAVAKPAAKKPAVKKAAATAKAPAKATPKKVAVKPVAARKGLAPDQRRFYVEVAAYYIAERRGFGGGSQLNDWVQAEAEIDRLLREGILNP